MRLYLNYDIHTLCNKILEEQVQDLGISGAQVLFGELEIKGNIPPEKMTELQDRLKNYGIEVMESQKSILVQKIKNVIIEMVYADDKLSSSKVSVYLAEKLGHSYGVISSTFSEITYTSIESYIILQKVERAKHLLATNELNMSEIAWKLNYSSTAHFCNQFKNTTGMTPSSFQRIMNKRRDLKFDSN